MISAVGVRNIVENQVDLTKSRNLIIAAVMFVSGLGFSSVGGVTFTVGGAAVTPVSYTHLGRSTPPNFILFTFYIQGRNLYGP